MQDAWNTFCFYYDNYVSSTQFISQQLVTCRKNTSSYTQVICPTSLAYKLAITFEVVSCWVLPRSSFNQNQHPGSDTESNETSFLNQRLLKLLYISTKEPILFLLMWKVDQFLWTGRKPASPTQLFINTKFGMTCQMPIKVYIYKLEPINWTTVIPKHFYS